MPSDAWADLNRRAAAVQGGVPWEAGARDENGQLVTGVGRGGAIHSVWGRRNGKRTGRPDLSHAGTRGILRAALESPPMDYEPTQEGYLCEVWGGRSHGAYHGHGDTREQAEAAALVALAEARNEWGPG